MAVLDFDLNNLEDVRAMKFTYHSKWRKWRSVKRGSFICWGLTFALMVFFTVRFFFTETIGDIFMFIIALFFNAGFLMSLWGAYKKEGHFEGNYAAAKELEQILNTYPNPPIIRQ